jgi:hypothetical protein
MAENQLFSAATFRPESFNGKRPEISHSWWNKFLHYLQIVQPSEDQKCALLVMHLAGDAEIWFSSLDSHIQQDFGLLEIAFKKYFITPSQDRSKQLSDLKNRFQGPNESVRSFITELSAKLRLIDLPRHFWLDFILQGIKPEIQIMLKAVGYSNDIEEFIVQAERIESAVVKPSTLLSTNTLTVTQSPVSIQTELEITMTDQLDKIQKCTEDLVKKINNVNFQKNANPKAKSTKHVYVRKQTGYTRNQRQPRVCYTCGIPGHISRNCFVKPQSHNADFTGYNFSGYNPSFQYENQQYPRNNGPSHGPYTRPRSAPGPRFQQPYGEFPQYFVPGMSYNQGN